MTVCSEENEIKSRDMWIERPPEWFRNLFPGVIFRMPPGTGYPGKVFLTFDDGPIPEATPRVLQILDEFDVKATFFMVGQNVEKYPYLFRQVVEKGHKAANHSLHHIRGVGISGLKYLEDVEGCEKYLHTRTYRPPHGWLTRHQLEAVKKDYKVVMYDLVTRDYSRKVSAAQIVDNVKKYTRDGSIIVFHDSLKSIDKLKTALPQSLKWLREQGYEFGLL